MTFCKNPKIWPKTEILYLKYVKKNLEFSSAWCYKSHSEWLIPAPISSAWCSKSQIRKYDLLQKSKNYDLFMTFAEFENFRVLGLIGVIPAQNFSGCLVL